jgi:hypothetical protein
MRPAERARVTARRVAAAAYELWLHPDRLVHSLWHGRPESVAEHFAYMKSRAWVPEELEGRKASFIAWAGLAYHVLIAWPLVSACKIVHAAAVRPLRFLCLAALVIPVLLISGIL